MSRVGKVKRRVRGCRPGCWVCEMRERQAAERALQQALDREQAKQPHTEEPDARR